MNSNHWSVLRRPLQFARVPHSTGHDGIGIDRTVLHLAQGFLLRQQEKVAAGFRRLAVWLAGVGRPEQRRTQTLKRNGGNTESQACREHQQNAAANQAIPAMTAGRTALEFSLVTLCFESIRQLLPTF